MSRIGAGNCSARRAHTQVSGRDGVHWVEQPWEIIKNYLRGWFVVDALSSLPIELIDHLVLLTSSRAIAVPVQALSAAAIRSPAAPHRPPPAAPIRRA